MTDRLAAPFRNVLRVIRGDLRSGLAIATAGRVGSRIDDLRTSHTRIPLTFTITNEDLR